jgi:hypothetical protein
MVGFELAFQLCIKILYLLRTVKAITTMAVHAPIPIAPKIKSNGGNALQFHNVLVD